MTNDNEIIQYIIYGLIFLVLMCICICIYYWSKVCCLCKSKHKEKSKPKSQMKTDNNNNNNAIYTDDDIIEYVEPHGRYSRSIENLVTDFGLAI